MKPESKIYTQRELELAHMLTMEYELNLEPGTYEAILDLKAMTRTDVLRVFFTFADGRKIIATVNWWSNYRGLLDAEVGAKYRLTYKTYPAGVFLAAAEKMEADYVE